MKFARFVAPLLAIYLLSAAALAAVATSPLPSSAPVASPTESKVEALVEGGATGAASSATQRKVLASIASHGKATRPAPRAVSALSSISPSVVLRQQASSSSSLASTAAPTSQPSQSSPPAGAPALVLAGRGKFRRQPLSTADEDIRAKRMSPTRPLEFVVDKSFGRNGKSNRTRRIGEHRSKVGNESFEDIHEQQIKDDPFAVPFGYSIFAVLLISIVFGRKIYDMTRNKKDMWTNPIVTLGGRAPRAMHRRLSQRSQDSSLTEAQSSSSRKGGDADAEGDEIEMQTFTPSFEGGVVSNLLTNDMIGRLIRVLPNRFGTKDWRMLYSTAEHGISLNQFYRKTRHQGATLTIVQDSNNYRFGVFVAESWHKSPAHFGNGESFVFSLLPVFTVYRWSEVNSFFAIGKQDFIACGGGNNFALWLDESFMHGSSKPCETFNSPQLGSHPEFTVCAIEVWGFA